jgi:hypothetical protein
MTNVIDFRTGLPIDAAAALACEFWLVDHHERRRAHDRVLFSAIVTAPIGQALCLLAQPLADQSAALWNSTLVQLRPTQPLPAHREAAATVSLTPEPQTGPDAHFFEVSLTRVHAAALMAAAQKLGLAESVVPDAA